MIRNLAPEERERYALAMERILSIPTESGTGIFQMFFAQEARFLLRMEDLRAANEMDALEDSSLEELQALNRELYDEILPEHYGACYGNPDMTSAAFGNEIGPMLSFLYTELRGAIGYAFEDREWDMLILAELFLEVYEAFKDGAPEPEELRRIFYAYAMDYCDALTDDRNREMLDPDLDFATKLVMESDLEDLRYLYSYGEYISDNELRMAAYMNSLSFEEVDAIARTWTEGFRIGFELQHKPLDQKKLAMLEYRIGFERMIRCAIDQIQAMGLRPILYRTPAHAVVRNAQKAGFMSTSPNMQYEYDHRNDAALFLDEKFVTRRLQATQKAYEKRQDLAGVHAGPLVLEVFGETPFEPEDKDTALKLTDDQEKEKVRLANESMQIASRYARIDERSFTIIAYPVPEIGDRFEAIFDETIRINNLDYKKYQTIQQHLIDALDKGYAVRVLGKDGNETDVTVQLHALQDPEKQTIFENCVADVNIPLGEVFTSPVLKGTSGLFHVKKVALTGLRFEDLRIRLEDGMVADYSCANFEDAEKGRKYIEENILFHHETVPLGEFAIGTNTTAYRIAKDYEIADILPILIAEKMGPHFAFGDTCYSWQEDLAVYNPDGKEIIARDNECSRKRNEDPSAAYYNCHTDITIPYEELGSIRVLCADGSEIALIEDGRFVLPGTEELNEPLDR